MISRIQWWWMRGLAGEPELDARQVTEAYLMCWHKQQWDTMRQFIQRRWVYEMMKRADPIRVLRQRHEVHEVVAYRVLRDFTPPGRNPGVFKNVTFELVLKKALGKNKKIRAGINLIKESGVRGKPDERYGTWGVVPESFRRLKYKKGGN